MDGMYNLTVQIFAVTGESAQNTSVWQMSGTSLTDTPYETAEDFLQAFNTILVPLMRPFMGNTAIIDFIKARKFDAPPGPYALLDVSHVGTIASPTSTLVEAADIRLKPGGRKNRTGHWFATGLPQSSFTGGRLTAPERTLIEAFAAALILPLALTSGVAEIGTWSRAIKPPKPPEAAFFTRTTDWEVAQKATGLNKRSLPLV